VHNGTLERRVRLKNIFEPIRADSPHFMFVPRMTLAGASAPLEDALLVERMQRDDESAFRALYARHARYIAGVVYRLLGDDSDLDDVVQDTFVDAALGLGALEDPSSLRRWLVVVAVRKVKALLSRRRRGRWFRMSLEQVAPMASNPTDRGSVDELYDALDRIPDKLRLPWVLSRIADEALPDVAVMCETSLATVKRRIAEAEQRLKRRLDAE
jgi:RNA polymerase sigma-70 factor (ECF subfamily)